MLSKDVKSKALNYELEYSKAYGADVTQYEAFTHIKNKYVNYAGDFNRAINLKFKDFDEFNKVIEEINKLHEKEGLEKPNNYYVAAPSLERSNWEENLAANGYKLNENYCLIREVSEKPLKIDDELQLINPSTSVYLNWHYEQERRSSYFNEDWYNEILNPTKSFIEEFKPFWFCKNNEIIGWVYCQFKGEICNAHDVWIEEKYRGKGLSRQLFNLINNEAIKREAKYINVFAFPSRKDFYETIGFEVYEKISIIQGV